MLPIFLAVLLWLPGLIGLGWLILRLHGKIDALRSLRRLGLAGICGLMVVSVIATAVNFFAAVTPTTSASILVLGWLLCVLHHRQLFAAIQRRHITAALIMIAIVSLSAARGMIEYDTGLYHLVAVKWITSTPLPLGLANLYGRLGFNSAWFPASALLEAPGLAAKSTFVLNPLFLVLFGLTLLDSAEQIFYGGFDRADFFLLLSAYPWAAYGFMFSASLHPDLPVILLTCTVVWLWLQRDESSVAPLLAITLSVFAVTLKLSATPLLVGALLVWRVRRNRLSLTLGALWALTVLAWVARGIGLSGCVLYPTTFTRIAGFDWSVPEARVQIEAACIRDWARYRLLPWQVPADGRWLGQWFVHALSTPPLPTAFALFVIGIILLSLRRKSRRVFVGANRIALLPARICIGGVIFWFCTAPDPRFGYGYVFSFAAIICCLGLGHVPLTFKGGRSQKMVAGLLAVLLLLVGGYFKHWGQISLLRWPAIPNIAFDEKPMKQGVVVNTPASGDQLWLIPLPATPYPDPALRYEMNDRGQFRKFWLDPAKRPMLVP